MQQSQLRDPKQFDYPDWHYQPLRLMKKELENPLEVIKAFFSGYTLPQAKTHFREMLEDAMCNIEMHSINYLTLYNSIEKLIEAAWLIKQQHKEETKENEMIVSEGKNILQAILDMLVHTIHPERIFLLSYEEGKAIDLLLIVSGSSNKSFSHYGILIEAACHSIPSVSFSLHESATFRGYLEEGYPFWLTTCRQEKQVYDSGTSPFPQPSEDKAEAWKKKTWDIFHTGMAKGCSFFDRAKNCLEEEDNGLALFMLHGAAELPLRALIRSLAGHEVKEHNLTVLLKHLRRCAPEITKIFPGSTEKDKALLTLLDSAYRKGRYDDDFTAETEDILTLMQKVELLQNTADSTYYAIVKSGEKREEQNA